MLEDVLGWLVVLVGAVVMRFTNFVLLDPIMSVGVAVFILSHAVRHLKEIMDLFLEKAPKGIHTEEIKAQLLKIHGVLDVHHIHIWSMDGQHNYATMHMVAKGEPQHIKEAVRKALVAHGIGHVTLELETEEEHCHEKECHVEIDAHCGHHHHH